MCPGVSGLALVPCRSRGPRSVPRGPRCRGRPRHGGVCLCRIRRVRRGLLGRVRVRRHPFGRLRVALLFACHVPRPGGGGDGCGGALCGIGLANVGRRRCSPDGSGWPGVGLFWIFVRGRRGSGAHRDTAGENHGLLVSLPDRLWGDRSEEPCSLALSYERGGAGVSMGGGALRNVVRGPVGRGAMGVPTWGLGSRDRHGGGDQS